MNSENSWPASSVEMVPIGALVPYARNARNHTSKQVDQIAASIKEWGWTIPVLVDERRNIIAGHGRVMAAHKLGIDKVPVMTAKGWTDAQKRAYVIADNKLAENAGWDAKLLEIEFKGIKDLGFDTALVGFDRDPVVQGSDDGGDGAGGGNSSGPELCLSIDGRKVAITADEQKGFQGLLDRYANEFGVHYGFAAWLCEAVGV